MTFILNILHKDMSILAADKHAVPASPNNLAESVSAIHDYQKIILNSSKKFAVGISGHTNEHYYSPEIEFTSSGDECIRKIRRHMQNFLRIEDRKYLNKLKDFMKNEGIATFYDDSVGMFYTNTYLFTPIEMQTKLHRGTDEIKIFHAGTGSRYFNNDLIIENDLQVEAIIASIEEVYEHISQKDVDTGSEITIFISNRSDGRFSELSQR